MSKVAADETLEGDRRKVVKIFLWRNLTVTVVGPQPDLLQFCGQLLACISGITSERRADETESAVASDIR